MISPRRSTARIDVERHDRESVRARSDVLERERKSAWVHDLLRVADRAS